MIRSIDFSAAKKVLGVLDIITYKDVPGKNDISPTGKNDEPILIEKRVDYWGQPIFLIVATNREIARHACLAISLFVATIKKIGWPQ